MSIAQDDDEQAALADVKPEQVVITQACKNVGLIRFTNGSVYDINIDAVRGRLDKDLTAADGDLRRRRWPDEELRRELGQALFGELSESCLSEWERVEASNSPPARIEVEGDADFHRVPWELLSHPNFTRSLGVPMVRRLKGKRRVKASPRLESELRILIVTARPLGLADVDGRAIVTPLLQEDRWPKGSPPRIEVLRSGSFERMVERLHRSERDGQPYQIVHFDMHGHVDGNGNAFVLFEKVEAGKDGFGRIRSDPRTAGELAQRLRAYQVQVAVFNACDSASSDGTGDGSNIALQLMDRGVPAAVGMRRPLSIQGGAVFVAELYEQLTHRSGDSPQPLSDAVMRARWAMSTAANVGEVSHDESSLPVVFIGTTPFLRVQDLHSDTFESWQRRRGREHHMKETLAQAGLYPIVGRDFDERIVRTLLFDVSKLLRPGTSEGVVRVVTITGLAGIGKTTLLLDLARHWDVVNFVDHAVVLDCERLVAGFDPAQSARPQLSSWIAKQCAESGLDVEDRARDVAGLPRFVGSEEMLFVIDHLEAVANRSLRSELSEWIRSLADSRHWVLGAATTLPGWITAPAEEFRMRALDPTSARRMLKTALGRRLDATEADELLRLSGRHPQMLLDLVAHVRATGATMAQLREDVSTTQLLRNDIANVLALVEDDELMRVFCLLGDLEPEVERDLLQAALAHMLVVLGDAHQAAKERAALLLAELTDIGLLEQLDVRVRGSRIRCVHLHPALPIRGFELVEQLEPEQDEKVVEAIEAAAAFYWSAPLEAGRQQWGSITEVRRLPRT